ncbi:hypothetical protein R69919_04954 [Paraburkholderia gardini]|jgi:hypothetical protein|uniref:Uncharacterized protein n=1 Tax=Paraburkholderia gardini TaxID=2823469 RepID=A0ABM8TZC7_9BURK|nr:hypothetical protein R54767_00884 [Paraburkholderia gardini]CAG4921928.1 hypothetical protein R69919_04954 [Paraburkholderia gardini]
MARNDCVPAGEFVWYRVGGDVNRLPGGKQRLIEVLP